MRADQIVDRYKAWPKWAQIGAPIAVVIVLAGIFGGGGDDKPDTEPIATAQFASIDDAVLAADVDVDGVSASDVKELIQSVCDGATASELSDEIAGLHLEEPSELRDVVEGVGRGAEAHCPEVAAEHASLINDTYRMSAAQFRPSTTTTEATTTTTTAPTTTTTAPPPPPTTQAPPPPPTTQAPPPPPAGVYYANCSEARAAGAAPLYSGDPGYRSGLDRDHDGVACE